MQPKFVRVENTSPLSRKAILSIGDQVIPFYSIDIHMEPEEFVTITAKVPAEKIDIVALEQHTTLMIEKQEDE